MKKYMILVFLLMSHKIQALILHRTLDEKRRGPNLFNQNVHEEKRPAYKSSTDRQGSGLAGGKKLRRLSKNMRYSAATGQTMNSKGSERRLSVIRNIHAHRLNLKSKTTRYKNRKLLHWGQKMSKTGGARALTEPPAHGESGEQPPKFEMPKPPEMKPPAIPEMPEIDGLEIPDPKELLMSAMGQGPKGNKISKMTGGNMNLVLGKEGSPIYIDQSPSYIYQNPKSEYNQNGLRLPLSASSAIVTNPSLSLVNTNFIRPRNLGSPPSIVVSDQNGYSVPQRTLRTMNLSNIASANQSGIVASPQGAVIQATLQNAYPEDPNFANEGESELSDSMTSEHLFEKAMRLITAVKQEIEGVEDTMQKNNDKIDTIINRFFDIKFS